RGAGQGGAAVGPRRRAAAARAARRHRRPRGRQRAACRATGATTGGAAANGGRSGGMNGPNPLDYGWWLASRSAGVVALIAVSISVIVGLLMANGLPRRPGAK